MNTCVYDKTDKGREEIATRKYHVPAKLRTLLVMIDGRNPLDALKKNFAVLGLTEDNVYELLNEQYITLVSGGDEARAEPAAPRPAVSARARMQARARVAAARGAASQAGDADDGPDVDQDDGSAMNQATAAIEHAAALPPAPMVVGIDNADRFRALYDFFNQTVKSTLGLRGLMFQLKVEKAASIDDFRELRQQYLEAVLKARGREMALSLRDRLDKLLGGAPESDDFALPAE